MKKGALASGALALGGSALGSASAQEDDGVGEDSGADETVLMLHPDAVENADFTVASGEIDWTPIGAVAGPGEDDAETGEDAGPVPEENPGGDDAGADGNETDDVGADGNETGTGEEEETPVAADGGTAGGGWDFTTYMIEYGFSASHVAPVFVEGDVDLSEGDERQLGEIEEIVEDPGGAGGGVGDDEPGADDGAVGDDTNGIGEDGEPLFVRVGLEDGGGVGDGPGDEEVTPAEPGDDDGIGEPGNETPSDEEDNGLFSF